MAKFWQAASRNLSKSWKGNCQRKNWKRKAFEKEKNWPDSFPLQVFPFWGSDKCYLPNPLKYFPSHLIWFPAWVPQTARFVRERTVESPRSFSVRIVWRMESQRSWRQASSAHRSASSQTGPLIRLFTRKVSFTDPFGLCFYFLSLLLSFFLLLLLFLFPFLSSSFLPFVLNVLRSFFLNSLCCLNRRSDQGPIPWIWVCWTAPCVGLWSKQDCPWWHLEARLRCGWLFFIFFLSSFSFFLSLTFFLFCQVFPAASRLTRVLTQPFHWPLTRSRRWKMSAG